MTNKTRKKRLIVGEWKSEPASSPTQADWFIAKHRKESEKIERKVKLASLLMKEAEVQAEMLNTCGTDQLINIAQLVAHNTVLLASGWTRDICRRCKGSKVVTDPLLKSKGYSNCQIGCPDCCRRGWIWVPHRDILAAPAERQVKELWQALGVK